MNVDYDGDDGSASLLPSWESAAAWLQGECSRLGLREASVWYEARDGIIARDQDPRWTGVVHLQLGFRRMAGTVPMGEMYHMGNLTPEAVDTRLRWRATDILLNAVRSELMGNVVRHVT